MIMMVPCPKSCFREYNSLNQLVCVLCNNVIKNDHLWQAHLLSKQHKEKVVALKTQGPAKPQHLTETTVKRKADSGDGVVESTKKRKTEVAADTKSKGLPADFFDNSTPAAAKNDVREHAKAALLAGYSSSEDSEEEEGQDEKPDTSKASKKGLPTDFFDGGDEAQTSEEGSKPESSSSKKMSEILPEGFFDDPKMDAKVRNVEYKDKMDEEWDLFKRAMKEEAHVSEVIIEEEDEQANIERNIDEIDDQIHRWQEVEDLHVKKETIVKVKKEGNTEQEESKEEDEEDALDQFLDWRAKKVGQ